MSKGSKLKLGNEMYVLILNVEIQILKYVLKEWLANIRVMEKKVQGLCLQIIFNKSFQN